MSMIRTKKKSLLGTVISNCIVLDIVQCMMSFSKLPISFWEYALDTATRVLNVLPRKSIAYNRTLLDSS